MSNKVLSARNKFVDIRAVKQQRKKVAKKGAHNIEKESTSLDRISFDEIRADPEIIAKKLDEKIQALLSKYGYVQVLTDFRWIAGQVSANLSVIKKPESEVNDVAA